MDGRRPNNRQCSTDAAKGSATDKGSVGYPGNLKCRDLLFSNGEKRKPGCGGNNFWKLGKEVA